MTAERVDTNVYPHWTSWCCFGVVATAVVALDLLWLHNLYLWRWSYSLRQSGEVSPFEVTWLKDCAVQLIPAVVIGSLCAFALSFAAWFLWRNLLQAAATVLLGVLVAMNLSETLYDILGVGV